MVKIYNVTGMLYKTKKISEWCRLPYPNHPKGCPNYNKSKRCPPNSPKAEDIFDLKKDHWFVIQRFDLGEYSNNMKIKHPKWSEKQCRCVLYWQNTIRKKLKEKYMEMKKENPELIYTDLPEAMGINVIRTVKNLCIPISVKPKDIIYKIALVGFPLAKDIQSKIQL